MPKVTESSLGTGPARGELSEEPSRPSGPPPNPTVLLKPDVGLPLDWRLPVATPLLRYDTEPSTFARLRALAARQTRLSEDREAFATWVQIAALGRLAHTDYAGAIEALSRALELAFDPAVRDDLLTLQVSCGNFSTASAWLLAARTTTPADPSVSRRIADYCIRSGDASRAAIELTELARLDPEATDVLDALGTLAFWAPEQVSRERGILAFHEAARRHRKKGDKLAAFEAASRAFELDPASGLAAERLAKDLEAQGRREAADEVWRKSADAASDPTRHDVRANAALESGDVMAAFSALLDGRADATFEEQAVLRGVEQLLSPRAGLSQGFDMVLAEIGGADWLAVRLELGPLCERWSDEAAAHTALSRLEMSFFSHFDAAREANFRAIAVQPAHPEARARLTRLGGDTESDELFRALVQSARTAQDGVVARQLAGELFERCQRDGGPAKLALWSLERLRYSSFKGEARERQVARFREQVELQDAEISELQRRLSGTSGEERSDLLRKLESLAALDPTDAIGHLTIVCELLLLHPDDPKVASRLIELLDVSAGLVISPLRDPRLASALKQAVEQLGERGRMAQARFYLRHGQVEQALGSLLALLDEPNTSVRGLLWVLTLARRFRDQLASARATERLAQAFRPAVRAMLEALAAQLYYDANLPHEALRVVGGALRVSQNVARLITLRVTLADYADVASSIEELERSLSRVMPDSSMCRVMANAYQQIAQLEMACVWIQRAVSLRPGDLELRREALALGLALGNSDRVTEILSELPKQALPIAGWDESAASALAWLAATDPAKARAVAQELLDAAGPANRSLRAAMLDVAQRAGDDTLALEILERAAAAEASDQERGAIQLALAERRLVRGEWEGYLRSTYLAVLSGCSDGIIDDDVRANLHEASGDSRLLALELERLAVLGASREPTSGPSAPLGDITRRLAIARHDLAEDVDGAVTLWVEYARLNGISGWPLAVRDFVEVLGHREALARVESLARLGPNGEERCLLLVLAAQVAVEAQDDAKALDLLETALRKAPERAFVLALVEQWMDRSFDSGRLDTIYGMVDRGVLGVHGSRALHHRAALAFAGRGDHAFALKHATAAFEAHPDYEPSFRLLVSVCQAANNPHELVASVTRIAELARDRTVAVGWLSRAFDVLREVPDEQRLKFDLAIRILVGAPRVSTVRAVSACLAPIEALGTDEFEFMRQRYVRALESLTEDFEGPDGARLGIAIFGVAVQELGRITLAASALFGAFQADADIEEFEQLVAVVAKAVKLDHAAMRSTLGRILDWLDRPYTAIGSQAVELLAVLCLSLGDTKSLWRLELRAVELGRKPWLLGWLLSGDETPWISQSDALKMSVELAELTVAAGDSLSAVALLEHGVRFDRHAASFEAESTSRRWQSWHDCYSRCLELLRTVLDIGQLRERLNGLEEQVPPAVAAELRVSLERGSEDPRALSNALAALAFCGQGSQVTRYARLTEAAQIAEQLGDLEGAVAYYRASVGTSRHSGQARLSLSALLYRLGRFTTPEQAEFLLEMTHGLEESVAEEDRDLVVYLRAEALTALGMQRQSGQLLLEAELRLGPRTFVVLALAERAFREGAPDVALGYFATALGGNLRDIRRRSEVALLSARAAASTSDLALALTWLGPALEDPATRPEAVTLQAELEGAAEAMRSALADESEEAREEAGVDRFDAESDLDSSRVPVKARAFEAHQEGPDAFESPELQSQPAPEAVTNGQAAGVALAAEASDGDARAFDHSRLGLRIEATEASTSETVEPIERTTPAGNQSFASEAPYEPFSGATAMAPSQGLSAEQLEGDRGASVEPSKQLGGPSPNTPARSAGSVDSATLPQILSASASGQFSLRSNTEPSEPTRAHSELSGREPLDKGTAVYGDLVFDESAGGNRVGAPIVEVVDPTAFEFAIGVAEELKADPERLRAWLPDGRRWLRQWPMQSRLVELVQNASSLEGHLSHAQALGHVVALLRGEQRLPAAPDLTEQPVDVDAVRALLLRDLTTPGAEALELIWDGAEHEFLHDPREYDITGLMRVVGMTSPIARIYAEATRHLGMTRTPLFHRKSAQASRIRVLLLNPTSLLCEGDPMVDESLLAYRMGGALCATLPGHALIFALPEDQVRQVFKALGLAFGSGGGQPNPTYGESLRLAQVLWQTVKSRSQRRLKEICQNELDFVQSHRQAKQALRRTGLYVSGDLGCALRAVCEEAEPHLATRQLDEVLAFAAQLPSAWDLFRFATSAEYADVRWQAGRLNQPGGGTRSW